MSDLHEKELVGGNKFSYEWFCTKTCLDPEVQGNSKIAYVMRWGMGCDVEDFF